MRIKEFLIKNREIIQLVYGIFLIVLIPLFIVINTVYIIKAYNSAIDVSLQRQALSLGRSVYSFVRDDLKNEDTLREKIKSATERNSDILELSILKPNGENFLVVASSDGEKTGEELRFFYYNLAWAQPENDGLATDSLTLVSNISIDDTEAQKIFLQNENQGRFWLVALPVTNAGGEKEALLTIKLSSKIIDELTNANRNRSTYILILTVLVSILFLMINIRLWDYALLYKKIKEVDRMKDEFVSMASHELRTPVTGIKGYTSMMLEGTLGEISDEAKNAVNKISMSAQRLAILVEDLLDVSRIEQGKLSIEPEPVDPGPIVQKVVDDMALQAKEKNLYIKFTPHKEKLPEINIDEDKFIQVLVNIIGNAIKYTEKGGVEITTREEKSKKLAFIVKDTGIGMSFEERQKLFQKFYRVSNEKTKGIGGTGLGLWIVREIINLMGGEISVDSIEEVGTQVNFSFPIIK